MFGFNEGNTRLSKVREIVNKTLTRFNTPTQGLIERERVINERSYNEMRKEFNVALVECAIGATIKETKKGISLGFFGKLPTDEDIQNLNLLVILWNTKIQPLFLQEDDMSIGGSILPAIGNTIDITKEGFIRSITDALSNYKLDQQELIGLNQSAKGFKRNQTITIAIVAGVIVAVTIGGILWYKSRNPKDTTTTDNSEYNEEDDDIIIIDLNEDDDEEFDEDEEEVITEE